jgi:hypothetical protein
MVFILYICVHVVCVYFMYAHQQLSDALRVFRPASVLHLVNADGKYAPKQIDVAKGVEIDKTVHDWTNYYLCGYKGITEELSQNGDIDLSVPIGMDCVVHGVVPAVRIVRPPLCMSVFMCMRVHMDVHCVCTRVNSNEQIRPFHNFLANSNVNFSSIPHRAPE